MHIWAIGDLHLSFDEKFNLKKPMEIFSPQWQEHPQKIDTDWHAKVQGDDLVLLCGDTSWALKPTEAVYDISWLKNLPGHKLIIKGNHDFWWHGIEKTKTLLAPIIPIYNTAVNWQEYAICGARGYRAESGIYEEHLAHKEYLRLEKTLEIGKASHKPIILMLHYPPYDEDGKENIFSELIKRYPVQSVVYGHLHKNEQNIIIPSLGHIPLHLVSADYLDFQLQRII